MLALSAKVGLLRDFSVLRLQGFPDTRGENKASTSTKTKTYSSENICKEGPKAKTLVSFII